MVLSFTASTNFLLSIAEPPGLGEQRRILLPLPIGGEKPVHIVKLPLTISQTQKKVLQQGIRLIWNAGLWGWVSAWGMGDPVGGLTLPGDVPLFSMIRYVHTVQSRVDKSMEMPPKFGQIFF